MLWYVLDRYLMDVVCICVSACSPISLLAQLIPMHISYLWEWPTMLNHWPNQGERQAQTQHSDSGGADAAKQGQKGSCWASPHSSCLRVLTRYEMSRLFTYPLWSAFDVQGRLSISHVAVLPLMSFYSVPAYNKGNKIKFGAGGWRTHYAGIRTSLHPAVRRSSVMDMS